MFKKSDHGFYEMFCFIVLFLFLLSACAKPVENPPQEEIWTASFGGQSADGGQSTDGGQAPQPGDAAKMTPKLTKVPTPTKTPEEQIEAIIAETGYPTVVPPREFTPKEGQTELVLWRSWKGGYKIDDYMVAELNHILQKRGYPFYLSLKLEPVPALQQLSPWQEIFDAGEKADLVFLFDYDSNLSGKTYGKTSIERMLAGGYLLPFSEYPDTPAKSQLRAAYGGEYWRMCSFGRENYGVSNWMLNYPVGKKYLLLNLDVAEQAGIEVPEKLDLLHLDELLGKAAAAGVPGIGANCSMVSYYGAELLPSGLFVKCQPDGGYSFVNPFEDGELLGVCDAMNRYLENGWLEYDIGKLPLVMCVASEGNDVYLEGDRFVRWENGEERSVRVKVYEAGDCALREGNLRDICGISSASRHPEEAAELLCLMHTDEEIVRLLRYGLEGIHYRLGEDGWEGEVKTTKIDLGAVGDEEMGYSYGIDTRESPGNNTLGNPRMPLELDETASVRYREDAGFYGDIGGVSLISYPGDLFAGKEDQLEKIRDVLYVKEGGFVKTYSLEELWMKSKAAYQKELERMRTALEEAGYNELIAELN